MLRKIALRYTGAGRGAFLAGVPARDLTTDEVERLGGRSFLLASGLYVTAGEDKKSAGPKEDKSVKESE